MDLHIIYLGKRGPSKRGRKKAGEGRGGGQTGASLNTSGTGEATTKYRERTAGQIYFILGITDQQSPDDGDADNNGQEIVKPPEPMLRIGSVSVKGFNSTEFTFTVDN